MDLTHNGHKLQLFTLLYFTLSSLLLSMVLGYYNVEFNIITNILISQYGMVGLVVLFYTIRHKRSIMKDYMLNKLSLVDGLICVGIALTIMPLLSFINVISQFFVKNQISSALADTLAYPYIVTLLLTAVTPAILEELLTRGIIINAYKKHTVLTVCFMSGIFFGFIHMNINQFLYALIMGMVMCYIVMITNSILSSIIIHFTINAFGVSMLYVAKAMFEFLDPIGSDLDIQTLMAESAATTNAQLALSAVAIFIFACICTPIAGLLINWLLTRHSKTFKGSFALQADAFISKETDIDAEKISNRKIMTPIYIATISLFILFAILTEVLTA